MKLSDCVFCCLEHSRIIDLELGSVFAIRDGFPVAPGHTLIIPRRHIATWFDATPAERLELWSAIDVVCDELSKSHNPDGYNFGINSGEVSGQTIPHLHLHVIPRYKGDVEGPRGGIRHVIPGKGNYIDQEASPRIDGVKDSLRYSSAQSLAVASLSLSSGPNRPLLPMLKEDIGGCTQLDIAVAFVFRSGLTSLLPHVEELLNRGGKFRLLTGDYLDATDPDALQKLLDLRSIYPNNCELYIYSAVRRSFHPKSYLMLNEDGENIAYVGSSNISHSALVEGVEWNYRVTANTDRAGWSQISHEFDELLVDSDVTVLSEDWIRLYRDRRKKMPATHAPDNQIDTETPYSPPEPNEIQIEALDALSETRLAGNRSGLVVMATGIGKTWLAAFDVASDRKEFSRILFVAHREEILKQSLSTFRNINPKASMGLYNGLEKLPNSEILFASIQTLSRTQHLEKFTPTEFDYIVVDEFHHAAASTYRKVIDYFQPKFMLGLTATPERTDGGDLLTLCDENLVYRCDVPRGIEEGLLSAYQYYGVPDSIDYENIPWRSRKFDEQALSQAAETHERAANVYEQWQKRGKSRTLAFCVSHSHANFMKKWFDEKGVNCAAVHSGQNSDPRVMSLEKLETGEVSVVFAVDMFNEGVDLPALDTVMMLRPTESSIIWLQQFGRGLRKQGNKVLSVIDYIGNHRSFLLKLRTLLNIEMGGDVALRDALLAIKQDNLTLPLGCAVTYDLEVIDILEALLRKGKSDGDALKNYYLEFREQHGQRPTASETYHDGYLPGTARDSYGSWFEMVGAMGDLSRDEQFVLAEHSTLLKGLETTSMSRSYKMVLLRAMLNIDAIPGNGASVQNLAASVRKITSRSSRLSADFGDSLASQTTLESSLVKNSITALTSQKALSGGVVFDLENTNFKYIPKVDNDARSAFQKLLREVIEWRLAVYLDRGFSNQIDNFCDMLVGNDAGKPVIQLPHDSGLANMPVGRTKIQIYDRLLEAFFADDGITQIFENDSDTNILSKLLREWFGSDAGLPGTNFIVRCKTNGDLTILEPQIRTEDLALNPFKRYSREQIPRFFSEEFNPGKWNSGHILSPTKDPKNIVLLVTLEKENMTESQQYQDRFISNSKFQWQSQNSTSQSSKKGIQLKDHSSLNMNVHLFVRKNKKIANRAAPFIYCGEVDFQSWDGDKPITIQWNLKEPLPEEFYSQFSG